jgi:G6PDH family F420-dependent oxidoreductase
MTTFGYFLSSEEHGPKALVQQAQLAEASGFSSVFISDHFHPWLDEQGESPFVWSVIGAIGATTALEVTTGVTCPTMRTHPAVIAQAAATSSLLLDGRFRLGVGTGENLNEHILGHRWPSPDERLDLLAEAIDVMRELWTGQLVSHSGANYVVDRARIYSSPDEPIPVLMSAFGTKAAEVAADLADGLVSTSPDDEVLSTYRKNGGKTPLVAAVKVCWDHDEDTAIERAQRLWRSSAVPGSLAQELAIPSMFDEASEMIDRDTIKEKFACGPDAQRHVEAIRPYIEAGFDEIFISQIGDDQQGWFDFFREEVEPRL